MNDQVALGQFTEIDLRAMPFDPPQTPPRMRGKTPEQLGGRQNDQVRRRKTKATRQGAFDEVNICERAFSAHQLAEALDFAFGLKVDDDPSLTGSPLREPSEKLRAFGFGYDQVAHCKFAQLTILKCAAEILHAF